MPLTSSDVPSDMETTRQSLHGPTMGTSWYVTFYGAIDTVPLQTALQAAVDTVDAQMSLWKPDSALNRLNAAAPDHWVDLPKETLHVLQAALDIGQQSAGAFDISVADAVCAWGFGPDKADSQRITNLLQGPARRRAHDLLELDPANRRARKHAPARFDLGGIAKGYGTDRLIEVAQTMGLTDLTAGIDGDLRCIGTRPDGSLWPVAIEAPDHHRRAVHSMMELSDTAIATSGDYRHWTQVGTRKLSHTMNPATGGPVMAPPASVTVLHKTCMQADAWATALMVLGENTGRQIARARGIQAMFLTRETEPDAPQMVSRR